jgi:RecA-family ATPase
MSDLFDRVYQGKPPIIDGLLYRGIYLFVGAPKIGKSFFMAQLAYHVSAGTPLWNYPVRKGTVLYLALEDDYPRLQKRLYRMFGVAENENLFFSVSADSVGKGLDEQIHLFIRDHPDTSLVIIDTLQKVREAGGDNYSYASDYQIITALKTLAAQHGICLLLVHHTRKQNADDNGISLSILSPHSSKASKVLSIQNRPCFSRKYYLRHHHGDLRCLHQ